MKFFRLVTLAIASLFVTTMVQAQTVDEVISKHIESIGGKEAWKKVNSIKINGILNVQGSDIDISLVQLHGKGMRQDITVQGMAGYQIVTPSAGWVFMPFQGQTEVTKMTEEDVKQAQNDLDTHGSFVEYKEKGHEAELAGKENIGGVECYKINLTLKSGKKETAFIDTKNYYVVRTITKQKMNGQEQDMETNFSGFEKTPEGIVIPKTINLPYGNMTLNNIEVNKPVDENIFKPATK